MESWRSEAMKFELEERVGKENSRRYYIYPIFVGSFATREEADAAAKLQEPQHGGIITVVSKPAQQGKAAPKRSGRKKPYLREARRRNGR
jgi:hypothetical protein